jgi:hypothetical protein
MKAMKKMEEGLQGKEGTDGRRRENVERQVLENLIFFIAGICDDTIQRSQRGLLLQ